MSDPLRPPASIKPEEAPKPPKLESRYTVYEAACGHRVHGTVTVPYGARIEIRDAAFVKGWEELAALPCSACEEESVEP